MGLCRTQGNLRACGRAVVARPTELVLYRGPVAILRLSFAFTLFKASARESHQSKLVNKSKTPEGTPQGPVNRGFATAYFGANSVASALNFPQERDLPKNHSHSKPHLSNRTPKPDISTWQRIGHFYLALTHAELVPKCEVLQVECGLRFEGRQMEELTEETQTPCPHSVRYFRYAQLSF